MKPLKIAHIGYGALGRMIASDIDETEWARVVTIIDPAVDSALDSMDDFPLWAGIDCTVVTTRSSLDECMDTFRELLEMGQTIVSTCEELAWPWLHHRELAEELH